MSHDAGAAGNVDAYDEPGRPDASSGGPMAHHHDTHVPVANSGAVTMSVNVGGHVLAEAVGQGRPCALPD